jgi:hypothetical protein
MKYRKNHLIRYIASAFLLSLGMAEAHADRIQYSYDESGNRISIREIGMRNKGDSTPADTLSRNHRMSAHRITIHPNPTDGRLKVEITGEGSLEGASISIFGLHGDVVYSDNEPDVENNIDISECPNGIYILIIRVDGEFSTWKLIKN